MAAAPSDRVTFPAAGRSRSSKFFSPPGARWCLSIGWLTCCGARSCPTTSRALQTFVSVLRRHLCADPGCARELVVTERGAYRFAVEHAEIDLDRFDRLLDRAGRVPTEAARRCLAEALSLGVQEVLEDEPYANWAQELRGTYLGRVIGANLEAAEAALATHDYRAGLSYSESAMRLDRFSERAHRTGMLALYAMGRTHEALESYRRLRSVLVGELGLEPSVETRSLEAAILRQEDVAALLPASASLQGNRASRPGSSVAVVSGS